MGIQASCPPGDFEQASKDSGEPQVSKPVTDGLSHMNDYEMQVSWETRILGDLDTPVEKVKRTVKITVAGREGT